MFVVCTQLRWLRIVRNQEFFCFRSRREETHEGKSALTAWAPRRAAMIATGSPDEANRWAALHGLRSPVAAGDRSRHRHRAVEAGRRGAFLASHAMPFGGMRRRT